MTLAIISDIHANLGALEAVLEDIRAQGITRIGCLGDVVGYGRQPLEVCDLVRERVDWCLMGNHDEAVLDEALCVGFSERARTKVEQHRALLKPGVFSPGDKKRRWEWLEKLPRSLREEDVLFVHASPRDHTREYILETDCWTLDGQMSPKIKECFDLTPWICFQGHTHMPAIVTPDGVYHRAASFGDEFTCEPGKKALINVGSVGRPRDGDRRACYVVFDGQTVRFRRVTIPALDDSRTQVSVSV